MLKVGKLDSDLLKKIVFEKITYKRPEVLTRPGIGEDCAVVDFGDYDCVMSTDPITAAVSEIGRLAIHITCNDIASNGVEPLGIMLAVMLPEGTTEEDVKTIMGHAGETAEELGVEIIGGHTEVTPAVNTPVIVSTAIGRAKKGDSQNASEMKPGDFILMTKFAGIEGSGILALDFEEELRNVCSQEEILEAQQLLSQVSVVREGVIAGKIGTAGMHDITEGGVLGAVWEMCEISRNGAELWLDKVPVKDITKKICNRFQINYLRLISSGCMLIIVTPEKRPLLEEALVQAGIAVSCIGVIKERAFGVMLNSENDLQPIAPPEADELYKVVK
ncbi:AIR synthase family protein [Clostridium aminobutyricum]|uniref:AIR synthase family protein n=1 Tax=Clostridium aminobutyricum TaxID=33953 RepID=A0A939IJS6_CLOAM|nr:AIR synthase family protein [Clostridium aminobutyricum]MBN7773879.1 AIR synthase family protein [Clostridium aminobutyricum]